MNTIVVGYDNSDAAQAALSWATEQAALTGGEIVVVYVASSISEWELAAVQVNTDAIRDEFKRLLNGEWTAQLRKSPARYRTSFAVGRVADELIRIARDERAALIVIGMSPRGTLNELVFGSTRHDLLHHAARPVVAVPSTWSHATAVVT